MSDAHAVGSAIIRLMQGVVYRESDEDSWLTLERSGAGDDNKGSEAAASAIEMARLFRLL